MESKPDPAEPDLRRPASCPQHKVIPGTKFLVDGFRFSGPWCKHYFLSHGHSDHYTGLRENWAAGTIYCSEITARLVCHKLQVSEAHVRVLPMRTPVVVEGVEVTLVDANHCPGAVQLLFRLADGRRYLHCGDMRFHEIMKEDALLSAYRGCDGLFLDTTYCNPRYVFPLQEESIAYVTRTIQQKLDTSPPDSVVFVISTYGIGKERILSAVAEACGVKICVTPQKLSVLRCLDLPDYSIFTTDPATTPVHIKGMDFLGDTFPYFRPNFTNMEAFRAERGAAELVGIMPTGWMYTMKHTTYAKQEKGPLAVHCVPYSEHSNYDELREYVRWLRPQLVIPTVGVDNKDKREKNEMSIHKHFRNLVNETASKANFLSMFHAKAAQMSAAAPSKGDGDKVSAACGANSGECGSDTKIVMCSHEPSAATPAAPGCSQEPASQPTSQPASTSHEAAGSSSQTESERDKVEQLRSVLGESVATEDAARLLAATHGNVAAAVNWFYDRGLAGLPRALPGATPSKRACEGSAKAMPVAKRGHGRGGKRTSLGGGSGVEDAQQRSLFSFFSRGSQGLPHKEPTTAATAAGTTARTTDAAIAPAQSPPWSPKPTPGAVDAPPNQSAPEVQVEDMSGGATTATSATAANAQEKAKEGEKERDGGREGLRDGEHRVMGYHQTKPAKGNMFASIQHRGSREGVQADHNTGGVAVPVESYDPVADACWKVGERAPYLHLARAFEAVESTSKRLRIGDILANAFRSLLALAPEDLLAAVYLTTGRLAPDYEGVDLAVGPSTVASAVVEATGTSRARMRELYRGAGDLGDVAQACRRAQTLLAPPPPLRLHRVYATLRAIATERGPGCAARKQALVLGLLRAARECEMRYLVRTLVQNLRIGANSTTVLAALARASAFHHHCYTPEQPKPAKTTLAEAETAVKEAFGLCPSLDQLVPALIEGGVELMRTRCTLTPGVPIRCMLAKVATGGEDVLRQLKHQPFVAEYKYDGQRAQIHLLSDGEVRVFSRNCEDRSLSFPDVAESLRGAVGRPPTMAQKPPPQAERDGGQGEKASTSAILDAELVAVDRATGRLRAFQELATRKRGETTVHEITVQVCIFAFDLLYLNGEVVARAPLSERRRRLAALLAGADPARMQLAHTLEIVPAEAALEPEASPSAVNAPSAMQVDVPADAAANANAATANERILGFLDQSLKEGCEGLMLKTLSGVYEPGRRADTWLKMKKDYVEGMADSFDLVVIGAWYGNGRKAGWYSPYLLACWDPEEEVFQSVCRCMSGFTDAHYKETHAALQEYVLEAPPLYYHTNEQPSVWFAPKFVWEIRGAELTVSPVHMAAVGRAHPDRGLSMRFPRYIGSRPEKAAEDATGPDEIFAVFHKQARKWQPTADGAEHAGAGNDDEDAGEPDIE